MGERTPDLEQRIDALATQLSALARRVAALERAAAAEPPGTSAEPVAGAAPAEAPPPAAEVARPAPPASWVSLAGRTLIALAGAYLLRAISDAGVLPGATAAAAGLLYAVWWLWMADRAGARGDRLGAAFHGLTACLIGFPLVLETAVRFRTISVPAAAVLVVALHAGAVAIARRRDLLPLAWLATPFAVATAWALVAGAHQLLPPALALLASAALIEWVGDREGWGGLRWPPAVAADALVLLLTGLLARPQGLPDDYAPVAPAAGVAVALALPLVYLASIALRTLRHDLRVSAFSILQSVAALLVGLGGAEWVLARIARGAPALHLSVLAFGAVGYAIAFSWIDRRGSRGRNFYYYATLALGLVLTGSRGLLAGGALAGVWAVLALVLAGLGVRFDRRTLRVQGAFTWMAAALPCGLWPSTLDALTAAATHPWRPLSLPALGVAVAGAACYGMMLRARASGGGGWETWPRALLFAALAAAASGFLARGLAVAAGSDAGVLATLRTAVLAGGALALSASRRRWSVPELGWAVHPFLVAGGLKLLAEDLPRGRPATLFVSFALYGGALVLSAGRAPRD